MMTGSSLYALRPNDEVSLNDLLSMQANIMKVFGIEPTSGTLRASNSPSKEELGAAIGITIEAAEVLSEMEKAGRVWKQIKDDNVFEKTQEELIDVIFFVLELAVLMNLNGEQIASAYVAKYKKNLLRVLNATATKNGGVNGLLVSLMDEQFGYQETERLVKETLEKKES